MWTTIPQFEQMVEDPDLGEFRMAWAAFSQALDRHFERDPSVTLARYQQLSDAEDFEATPLLTLQRPGTRPADADDPASGQGPRIRCRFHRRCRRGKLSRPEADRRSASPRDAFPRPGPIAGSIDDVPAPGGDAAGLHRDDPREDSGCVDRDLGRDRRGRAETLQVPAGRLGTFVVSRYRLAPVEPHQRPITSAEAQATLRRTLTDPSAPAVERLSALATLCDPPRRGAGPRRPSLAPPNEGPTRGVVSAPFRLSPTQAETYDRCPRQYAFERRLGAGDTFSPVGPLRIPDPSGSWSFPRAGRSRANSPTAPWARRWQCSTESGPSEADFGSPVLNDAYKAKGPRLAHQDARKLAGGHCHPHSYRKEV